MSDRVHVVCPHCRAINRIARADLGPAAYCGRCGKELFSAQPLTLASAADFDRQLQRSELPLLVDFWAPWCGPCRMMAPAYEQAAATLQPAMRVARVDTEAVPALASRYGIRSIPTLMLFRGGAEVARQSGAMTTPAQIAQWARSHAQ